MKVLALDMGEKRIGLAVSDDEGLIAQPLDTHEYAGDRELLRFLQSFISEHGVEKIVIGLPVHMSGEERSGAKRVRALAGVMSSELNIPVDLWDERLSTVEAERLLVGAGVSRKKRKKKIDNVAAALILQGYLDYMKNTG